MKKGKLKKVKKVAKALKKHLIHMLNKQELYKKLLRENELRRII